MVLAAIVLRSRSFLVMPRLSSSGGKRGRSHLRAFRLPSQHACSHLGCNHFNWYSQSRCAYATSCSSSSIIRRRIYHHTSFCSPRRMVAATAPLPADGPSLPSRSLLREHLSGRGCFSDADGAVGSNGMASVLCRVRAEATLGSRELFTISDDNRDVIQIQSKVRCNTFRPCRMRVRVYNGNLMFLLFLFNLSLLHMCTMETPFFKLDI
jgi:hypothetical protein